MTAPWTDGRLVAGFAERLVAADVAPLAELARTLVQLAGGTCVVLQSEGAGVLRPVGQATTETADAGLLDAVLQAAAIPADQSAAIRAAIADGPSDVSVLALPDVLRNWCRHRRPVRSVVLPLDIADHTLGVVWLDVRNPDSDLGEATDLVAVALARHLAVLDAGSSTEWAMRAETAMSARSEELETANQWIDRLGSFVGHELRDSLRGLLGWSRLASAADIADEVRREMLRKIVHSAEQAGALVGDLLEDVEAQQAQRLSHVAVDLNGVVGWVREVLGERIERQRASLVAEALPTVQCNPTALRRTVLELVRNSLEHGGRFVEVQVRATVNAGLVELTIEDNGPGIDEDDREQVFLPGVGTGVGAGFGLTNAREALYRIGGEIWIEEGSVGGTAVRITLPRPDHVAEEVPASF